MDAGQVTIRRVGADEVEAFRRIRLEALRVDPCFFASSVEDWEALPDEEWNRRLTDPVFLAFLDRRPVGIMGLQRQRPRKMAHRAVVIMVYVSKDLRGTGLAKRLLDVVAGYARDAGILQLELIVSARNPAAIRFYQREGFTEVGRIPAGFLHDDEEIDDVMMVRRLTS